jgi:hypothetical protein
MFARHSSKIAANLNVPHISYYGNDVPRLGGSADNILWDSGLLLQFDDETDLLWDNATGISSSDVFFASSYPKTQYTGSV